MADAQRFTFDVDSKPIEKPSLAGPNAIAYFPTPQWFAAAMIDRYLLPRLQESDIVLEPACGDGSFLRELPAHVNGYGAEIDEKLADEARASSGRMVLNADVLRATLPIIPTKIIGNPPFSVAWLNSLLDKMHAIAEDGLELTLLLPSYVFQTSSTVVAYGRRYSIEVESIPRDLFAGFDKPLCVARFTKEEVRRVVGLAFYQETNDWRQMPPEFNAILRRSQKNVWIAATLRALHVLGGRGTVDEVARVVTGFRPTPTEHWREAIRKSLQQNFVRVERGTYAIPKSLIAA